MTVEFRAHGEFAVNHFFTCLRIANLRRARAEVWWRNVRSFREDTRTRYEPEKERVRRDHGHGNECECRAFHD